MVKNRHLDEHAEFLKGSVRTPPLVPAVIDWSTKQADIRAVILGGSHVQPTASPDALSDLDVVVYSTRLNRYTSSDAWMSSIAPVWVYEAETADGYPQRLVIFNGGHKVDFSLRPFTLLEEEVRSQTVPGWYHRGYTVLVDKDGLAASLPPPSGRPPITRPPTASELRKLCELFWFEAYHVAKYLKREELFAAKGRHTAMIFQQLLPMLEWYEKSKHGWQYDTLHLGHHMKTWLEPEVWNELQGAFSGLQSTVSWDALETSTNLFRRVATATAKGLQYSYPSHVDQNVSRFITSLHGACVGDHLTPGGECRDGQNPSPTPDCL